MRPPPPHRGRRSSLPSHLRQARGRRPTWRNCAPAAAALARATAWPRPTACGMCQASRPRCVAGAKEKKRTERDGVDQGGSGGRSGSGQGARPARAARDAAHFHHHCIAVPAARPHRLAHAPVCMPMPVGSSTCCRGPCHDAPNSSTKQGLLSCADFCVAVAHTSAAVSGQSLQGGIAARRGAASTEVSRGEASPLRAMSACTAARHSLLVHAREGNLRLVLEALDKPAPAEAVVHHVIVHIDRREP